jgi:hypothetical protein
MRAELADAVGGLIKSIEPEKAIDLTRDEIERILLAADITTRARTGVELDYRGDVSFAHKPEAPTRFAKQLVQLVRGAVAIGMRRPGAINLAIRGARDSMPATRLNILEDIEAHPGTRPGDIRKRIDAPWRTVDRQCQALHMLRLVTCDEDIEFGKTIWRYRLRPEIQLDAVKASPDLSVHEFYGFRDRDLDPHCMRTDKSGEGPSEQGNGHAEPLSGDGLRTYIFDDDGVREVDGL